jgi:hypothetical protein
LHPSDSGSGESGYRIALGHAPQARGSPVHAPKAVDEGSRNEPFGPIRPR